MEPLLGIPLLVTIFACLVAILFLYKRHRTKTLAQPLLNLEQLVNWLQVDHGYRWPTMREITCELNRQAKLIKPVEGGEQWTSLTIERLLPGTELPSFQIVSIPANRRNHICVELLIEWPMCLPGVEISVKDEAGDKVTCHLQVDWIIMMGKLSMDTVEQKGVKLSWQQTAPSTSAMSCLVVSPDRWKANIDIMKPITEEDRPTEHSENLASSVTEGFIKLLEQLSFSDLLLDLHKKEEEEEEKEEEEEREEEEREEEERENDTNNELTTEDIVAEEKEKEKDEEEGKDDAVYNENDNVIHHPLASEPTLQTTPTLIHTDPLTTPLTTNEPTPTEVQNPSQVTPSNTSSTVNGSIHKPHLHWENELPVISEPVDEVIAEEAPPTQGSPTDSAPWRRSSSYENLNATNIMPEVPLPPSPLSSHHSSSPPTPHQTRPQYSPLLMSRSPPPWSPSTPPQPHPHPSSPATPPQYHSPSTSQLCPSPPTYLKVAQSDEDLLSERSKRRAMTYSVRSYDTDTPVTTGRLPSTLVYEIEEGSHKRHIVAINGIHAAKLRKQLVSYTKLHIYNDHTFTATHIKGKQLCGVCSDKVTGLFGKQCYICRDCSFLVHKECHYKIEIPCPKSKVSHMCLIYPDSISSISQF